MNVIISADLRILRGKKFTLIGTPEGEELKDPSRKFWQFILRLTKIYDLLNFLELEFLPDVINDLDVDFTEDMAASNRYQHDLRNIRKVQEATKNLQINIIHPLREGKKLLVLDIDYSKRPTFSVFVLLGLITSE